MSCRRGLPILLIFLALPPVPARAELRFERESASLGTIKSGLPVVCCFAFVNAGNEPVEIVEARGECGCVVPRLGKRTFAPGERGEVPVEMNTLGESAGPHRWHVYVTYRDGGTLKLVPLQVVAEVVTEVSVQPAKVSIHTSGPVRHVLRLTDLRPAPLAIRSLRTTSPHLKATAEEPRRDRLGHCVITVRLDVTASFPEGQHEECLHIDTTDPVYQELKVPVTVVKRSQQTVSALPASVEVRGRVGQPLPARLLLVRSAADMPLDLGDIRCDHPAVACRWAKGPGNSATVRVEVDARKLRGREMNTLIHIHVVAPAREVVSVPVRCRLEDE